MSSIPVSVGYISYPMSIEPTITLVSSGFSGIYGLTQKIVLKKEKSEDLYNLLGSHLSFEGTMCM